MRRLITVLIAAAMTMTLLILKANAQGKGNAKGHHKQEWKHDRHSSTDQYNYDRSHRSHREEHQHYSGHHHKFVHQHSHHCDHRVVVRHYERPRYVFYRDHDFYYDNYRKTYISYSGRGWTVTARLPIHLRHVNLNTAVCHSVNYHDDDLVSYLRVGRPMYGAMIPRH